MVIFSFKNIRSESIRAEAALLDECEQAATSESSLSEVIIISSSLKSGEKSSASIENAFTETSVCFTLVRF